MPVSVSNTSHDQKSHVAPHVNHLDVKNAMMPFTVPSASCNMLLPKVSHDQGCHVVPHFDCLGLTNAMVPFMMPIGITSC